MCPRTLVPFHPHCWLCVVENLNLSHKGLKLDRPLSAYAERSHRPAAMAFLLVATPRRAMLQPPVSSCPNTLPKPSGKSHPPQCRSSLSLHPRFTPPHSPCRTVSYVRVKVCGAQNTHILSLYISSTPCNESSSHYVRSVTALAQPVISALAFVFFPQSRKRSL